MRKATDQLLKLTPGFLGAQLVKHYRWAKAANAYYKAQGKSVNTAYRCLTRSFLRVLGAIHRNQTTFDEERYIAALKRKGVPWAMTLSVEPENAGGHASAP